MDNPDKEILGTYCSNTKSKAEDVTAPKKR
jgi:hypothetical protein